jgi:hypothetical protein
MLLPVCDLPGMFAVACVSLIVNTPAVACGPEFHVKFLVEKMQIYMKNKKNLSLSHVPSMASLLFLTVTPIYLLLLLASDVPGLNAVSGVLAVVDIILFCCFRCCLRSFCCWRPCCSLCSCLELMLLFAFLLLLFQVSRACGIPQIIFVFD